MSAIGQVVGGRYRIERRLGEGGFGAVYEATDEELRRTVAVKLLDPAQGTSGAGTDPAVLRERFRQEAVITAAITHPNVVTIYDVGIDGDHDDGDVYIVMELLEGHSLKDEFGYHPNGIAPIRMLPHFIEILEGLGVGHEAGVVHKDLKPANLFLTRPGSRREMMSVIDFGIARVLHEQKLTATGRLVGTPRYLAPEYILEHRVTPALDVYQVGLLLVETVTGIPCVPRGLAAVECCERHVRGMLRVPDYLRDGPLGPILERALALDPSERYASGLEFSEALATVRASEVTANFPDLDGATLPVRMVPVEGDIEEAKPAARYEPTVSLDALPDSEPTMTVSNPSSGDRTRNKRGLVALLVAVFLFAALMVPAVLFFGPTADRPSDSTPADQANERTDSVATTPAKAEQRQAAVDPTAERNAAAPAKEPDVPEEPSPEPAVERDSQDQSKEEAAEEPEADAVATDVKKAAEPKAQPAPKPRPKPAAKPRPEPEKGLRIID